MTTPYRSGMDVVAAENDMSRVAIATRVLIAEGGGAGSNIHSWRCSDKERYPDPCRCAMNVAAAIFDAIDDAERRAGELEPGLTAADHTPGCPCYGGFNDCFFDPGEDRCAFCRCNDR